MQTLTTISAMRSACAEARRAGLRLGFVPTMGALHDGHLSLVSAARNECDLVAVSIFVNPTQFGPHEDFAKYPRDLGGDTAMLAAAGVDLLFAPAVEEMYPPGAAAFVEVAGLSDRLDGRSRPGHFRGVATIVTKLFHVVTPDLAYFGQKDAAQVAVIRKLVEDLDLPITIVACPTVREADGLAMSSRNAYLSPAERQQARVLSRALAAARAAYAAGERSPQALLQAARAVFAAEPAVVVDYIELVDPATLLPLDRLAGPALLAVAAKVGATRLIDNMVLP